MKNFPKVLSRWTWLATIMALFLVFVTMLSISELPSYSIEDSAQALLTWFYKTRDSAVVPIDVEESATLDPDTLQVGPKDDEESLASGHVETPLDPEELQVELEDDEEPLANISPVKEQEKSDEATEDDKEEPVPPSVALGDSNEENKDQLVLQGVEAKQACDVYSGTWVRDESYPLFQPFVCPFLDEGFRCQENGRTDKDYLKWRWQPHGCNLPRFNATDMLGRLRQKRVVFIGDSIGRNQWESLVCMLYQGVPNRMNVAEARGQRVTKTRGSYVIRFKDYNARVEYYRSHFLVREGKRPPGANKRIKSALRLDKVDNTASKWKNADVLVFNSGHWWNHAKIKRGKCYFVEGDNYTTNMGVLTAYEKALRTWSTWVDRHVEAGQTQVFFRGFAPSHFSGGQWNTGGTCHGVTQPMLDESLLGQYPNKMQVVEKVLNEMKTPVTLLNITKLSLFRSDGHIATWERKLKDGERARQDCSHWCLPGVPDTWNELLYASLTQADGVE